MPTEFSMSGTVNPNGLLDSSYDPETWGIIADYRFYAGDLYEDKNGFSWNGSRTISTPAGQSEAGGIFSFPASPDPRGQSNREQRYSFDPMSEFWFKKRIFIPANYFHRSIITMTVAGNIASWQRGDSMLANDGVSTGTIEFISGTTVILNFAESPYGYTWDGNLTNVTRSQTRTSSATDGWPDNNKFHAFWCDGYSSSGFSPSVIYEIRPSGDKDGGSRIYHQYGADGQGTGAPYPSVKFIEPQDFGTWIDCIFHIKMATTESATDGVIEFWRRRSGETSYTKLLQQTNAAIGARAASGFAQFQAGYCHGYANIGYYSQTDIFDSRILLRSEPIDGAI
jgi:hypothetical protein